MLVREADMGLFKKKNPQDAFDPDVFTITDTILDPPRFTFFAGYLPGCHASQVGRASAWCRA